MVDAKCALSSFTFAGGRSRSSCLFVMGRESGYREGELGLGGGGRIAMVVFLILSK